ncbi:Protein N-terminal asparagine amidohydrolase [Lamellibrachia satsuma]|nr:Protein N-terminal asparagine amidohydrolase [Lamellibrachia satsuma]
MWETWWRSVISSIRRQWHTGQHGISGMPRTRNMNNENARQLLQETNEEIGPKKLLYVNQREYAVVCPNDEHIDVIGTDDATTCHILVIRHSGSGVTGLAHCDGCGVEEGIDSMMNKISQFARRGPDGRYELHLAGGFLDDRKQSAKLSLTILEVMMKLEEEVHLMTLCITDANDTLCGGTHFPVIYGLAVHVKTGQIAQATFPSKGPDMDIRSATHFVGWKRMLNIYDNETGRLMVGPYNWKPMTDIDLYLALSDAQIRQYLSTSPEQEPPHFENHVRKALTVLKNHPKPHRTLFPNDAPRCYAMDENGQWNGSNHRKSTRSVQPSESERRPQGPTIALENRPRGPSTTDPTSPLGSRSLQ